MTEIFDGTTGSERKLLAEYIEKGLASMSAYAAKEDGTSFFIERTNSEGKEIFIFNVLGLALLGKQGDPYTAFINFEPASEKFSKSADVLEFFAKELDISLELADCVFLLNNNKGVSSAEIAKQLQLSNKIHLC